MGHVEAGLRTELSLLPPLEYLPLVQLLKRCHFVMTDSGGLQEEAPPLGKPVLVLRDSTERSEASRPGPRGWRGPTGRRLEGRPFVVSP